MTQAKTQEWATGIRALSLVVAGLLWLSVILERNGEVTLQVPVRPERIPAGLTLLTAPGKLEVGVSGPRVLLMRLEFQSVVCPLDLAGAVAGTSLYTPREGSLRLDRDLKVTRISPGTIQLTLVKGAPK